MSTPERVVRIASKNVVRVDSPMRQDDILKVVLQVVDIEEENETVVDSEVFVLALDHFPSLSTTAVQEMIDARKAALLTRANNRESLDLDLLT